MGTQCVMRCVVGFGNKCNKKKIYFFSCMEIVLTPRTYFIQIRHWSYAPVTCKNDLLRLYVFVSRKKPKKKIHIYF